MNAIAVLTHKTNAKPRFYMDGLKLNIRKLFWKNDFSCLIKPTSKSEETNCKQIRNWRFNVLHRPGNGQSGEFVSCH